MPAKKTTKVGAKKLAAAIAENLALAIGAAEGAAPVRPLTEAARFNGNVHYAGVTAVLVTSGRAFLLIMFNPTGNNTPSDIGATASFLRFVLGKQEGAPLSIEGHIGNSFGQPCIFMISAS